jgi:outer membrane protein assembly factor BamB
VRDGVVAAFDSTGSGYILDAETGDTKLDTERINVGANVEASPIVWKGRLYVGMRGGAMICLGNP